MKVAAAPAKAVPMQAMKAKAIKAKAAAPVKALPMQAMKAKAMKAPAGAPVQALPMQAMKAKAMKAAAAAALVKAMPDGIFLATAPAAPMKAVAMKAMKAAAKPRRTRWVRFTGPRGGVTLIKLDTLVTSMWGDLAVVATKALPMKAMKAKTAAPVKAVSMKAMKTKAAAPVKAVSMKAALAAYLRLPFVMRDKQAKQEAGLLPWPKAAAPVKAVRKRSMTANEAAAARRNTRQKSKLARARLLKEAAEIEAGTTAMKATQAAPSKVEKAKAAAPVKAMTM